MAEWLRRINSRRLWGDTAQWGPTSTIVCVSKFGGNKSSPAGVFFFFFFFFFRETKKKNEGLPENTADSSLRSQSSILPSSGQ